MCGLTRRLFRNNLNMKLSQFISNCINFFIGLLIFAGCRDDSENSKWKILYTDSSIYAGCVKFWDDNHGFVLGNKYGVVDSGDSRQVIVYTTNGGKTWIKNDCKFPQITDGLHTIYLLDKKTLLGIGAHVYKSIDYGKNWSDLWPDHPNTISELFIKSQLKWLMADGTRISLTNDGGVSWKKVYVADVMLAFDHIMFLSDSIGYACGGSLFDWTDFSEIIKTTDGGENWTKLDPEPWKSLKKVIPYISDLQFLNENVGFLITGDYPVLYKTIDGGNNWSFVDTISAFRGEFISEKEGYLIYLGSILHTKDGGHSWLTDYEGLNDTETDGINDMYVRDDDVYVTTRRSLVLKK
jgi:photosystem II stability/assembly factor-like uncharacterized protein